MNFLLYTRPVTNDYFIKLVKKINHDADFFIISDFKNQGDVWMGQYLNNKNYAYENIYNNEESQEIIDRCRFLRSIDNDQAIRLINIYSTVISKIMNENDFDCVLSQIVDNYCMDIIEREALKRNIPVIATCVTFINGYSRFTIRGEWRALNRIVTDEEVDKLLDKLLDTNFKGRVGGVKVNSNFDLYKMFYRRLLIEKIYNPLRKVINNDWYNYHYNTRVLSSIRPSDYIINSKDFFDSLDKLDKRNNLVYVPLHFTPEATTDYFGDNKKFGYYEKVMIDFFENSGKSITFVVKDHPAMIGWRKKSFYKKLKTFENIVLLDSNVSSNLLLDRIDNVVTCTGSVGVEALLRNKKVFVLTENYYSDKSPNVHVIEHLKMSDIEQPIIEYSNKALMKDLLSGLIKIHIYAEREMNKIDISSLAKEIRKYYNV